MHFKWFSYENFIKIFELSWNAKKKQNGKKLERNCHSFVVEKQKGQNETSLNFSLNLKYWARERETELNTHKELNILGKRIIRVIKWALFVCEKNKKKNRKIK